MPVYEGQYCLRSSLEILKFPEVESSPMEDAQFTGNFEEGRHTDNQSHAS